MKRKVVLLIIVGSFLLGNVAFASINYYADLLRGQKDSLSSEITSNFKSKKEEIQFQNHNDLIMSVEMERNRIIAELEDYTAGKLGHLQSGTKDDAYNEIVKEADLIIKEIKLEIDKIVGDFN